MHRYTILKSQQYFDIKEKSTFVRFFYINFINLFYFICLKDFFRLLKQIYISCYLNVFRIKLFRSLYY